jgi:hypothetical protein|tara:strand:+ start:3339 stop:3728 length:390 start_codon:yes stop_codon:yes gene_type:complete
MRRKNTRRFDPRYYMDEKMETLNEFSQGETRMGSAGGLDHLTTAVFKALRDGRHDREDNPLSLSGIKSSVPRYLAELGLDERGVKETLSYFRQIMQGGEFMTTDGDSFKLVPATVRVGAGEGERGLYLV